MMSFSRLKRWFIPLKNRTLLKAMTRLQRFLLVLLSVALLIPGWLSGSGLPLLAALVPLLLISHYTEHSKRGWWSMFWWALLCFVLWNVTTIWWIWFATPVGPVAATLVSSTLSMIAFMSYHAVSKRCGKPLAYTLLVTLWIALEYWYTTNDISWPWLLLGNGFSNDIWAVQWYEYTGLFGGTLWVLVTNLLIFEAIIAKSVRRWVVAAIAAVVPILISLAIYFSYSEQPHGSIKVSVVQPNIHFGSGGRTSAIEQEANLLHLMQKSPLDVDYIVMPEVSAPQLFYMEKLNSARIVREMRSVLDDKYPDAAVVVGGSTLKYYDSAEGSPTVRERKGVYYDIFNSAIYIPADGDVDYHHKSKLVIGTESTPLPWLFKALEFLVIDLGGVTGQLGRGDERRLFSSQGERVGAAICYEALYGEYFGEFVNGGAEAMFVISNDCWWGDTPGYRHLFAMSGLRAVEHRRAIARSANTGISGFISSRGDAMQQSRWDERVVLTDELPLNSKITLYTQYGDYIARVSVLLAALCSLCCIVMIVKGRD